MNGRKNKSDVPSDGKVNLLLLDGKANSRFQGQSMQECCFSCGSHNDQMLSCVIDLPRIFSCSTHPANSSSQFECDGYNCNRVVHICGTFDSITMSVFTLLVNIFRSFCLLLAHVEILQDFILHGDLFQQGKYHNALVSTKSMLERRFQRETEIHFEVFVRRTCR